MFYNLFTQTTPAYLVGKKWWWCMCRCNFIF